MTKIKDFLHQHRLLSVKEIYAKMIESRKKIIELEQGKILGKVKNYREIRQLKRELARLITILDEKLLDKAKE